MPDALSFIEINEQHVELLPARTVMSLINLRGKGDAPKGGQGQDGGPKSASASISLFDSGSRVTTVPSS
jgi:hypothetical protein